MPTEDRRRPIAGFAAAAGLAAVVLLWGVLSTVFFWITTTAAAALVLWALADAGHWLAKREAERREMAVYKLAGAAMLVILGQLGFIVLPPRPLLLTVDCDTPAPYVLPMVGCP